MAVTELIRLGCKCKNGHEWVYLPCNVWAKPPWCPKCNELPDSMKAKRANSTEHQEN